MIKKDKTKFVKLIKRINRNNNTIIINGNKTKKIDNIGWEDIDSLYYFNNWKFGAYFICPKGKHYMHEYLFSSNKYR